MRVDTLDDVQINSDVIEFAKEKFSSRILELLEKHNLLNEVQQQALILDLKPSEKLAAIIKQNLGQETDLHVLGRSWTGLVEIFNGTFGFCLDCDESIDEHLLFAAPYRHFCDKCQAERDAGSRNRKSDIDPYFGYIPCFQGDSHSGADQALPFLFQKRGGFSKLSAHA